MEWHYSLPIVVIWMDCNEDRFFSSNCPPKSLKLYSPILVIYNSVCGMISIHHTFSE